MKTQSICKGVDFHSIDAPKFKTNLITVYFNIPLKRETVTSAALLPAVLKRGTEKYPTMKELSRRLDDMYAASVSAGVRMKGDGEVLYFSIGYVADRFFEKGLTEKAAEFLHDFIFSPLTENGAFNRDYVDGEKVNLKNAIQGLVNDKRAYTEFKCREEMFDGEGYGMFEAGYEEDLSDITPESLYEFYLDVIKNAKADVFFSGTADEETENTVKSIFAKALEPRKAEYVKTIAAEFKGDEVREIEEEADVSQSKLCIGMRCGVAADSPKYPALVVANCIFGGSAFSKLFMNVREKLSLCYYAAARYVMTKSVMTVSSGIQTENYQAAYDEIMNQFKDMQDGNISDFEIESAKKYLCTAYNSINDSLRGTEDYYLTQAMLGSNRSIDELLNLTSKVTVDEIAEVMKNTKPDVVYFLKGVSAE